MRKGFLFLLLFPNLIWAGNIAIIDAGGISSHINSISEQILIKKCFSDEDDSDYTLPVIGQDRNINRFFIYKKASGCPNGGTSEHNIGERIIPESLYVDNSIDTFTLKDSHLSDVTHNALRKTSQKVLLISIPTFASNSGNYVAPVSLELEPSANNLLKALNYVLVVHQTYNIRVLNLSLHAGAHFTGNGYCDNIEYPDIREDIKDAVNQLVNSGVAVVVAAGNENPVGTRVSTRFPACLSNVVSVGGYTSSNGKLFLYGSTSVHQTYIENAVAIMHNNGTDTGTSYAAPKVAGYISELMAINPALSTGYIVNHLYNTASHTGRVYHRDTNETIFQVDRLTPNFTNALNSLPDVGLSIPVELSEGIVDGDGYGWSYGTNQHKNGILSKFLTFPYVTQSSKFGTTPFSNAASLIPVYRFSFKAFDIDSADEVRIYVNDVFYGYVDVTGNNALGGTQSFYLNDDDLVDIGSENEVKLIVKSPGSSWGVTDLLVEQVEVDECLVTDCTNPPVQPSPSIPPIPPIPQTDDTVFTANAPIGSAYGGSNTTSVIYRTIALQHNYPSPTNFDQTTVLRDLNLNYVFKAGDTYETRNGISLSVNGVTIYSGPLYYDGLEHQYSIIVGRDFLNAGTNEFEFSAKRIHSGIQWGIKNIHVSNFTPLLLEINQQSTALYGTSGDYRRYSDARLSFMLEDNSKDLKFIVTGWDIDAPDEIKVHINGHSLGYLSQSPSDDSYSDVDAFVFRKANLVVGKNVIELTRRYPGVGWSGNEDKKWLVQDLLITEYKKTIAPIIYLLLDDD